MPRAVERFAAYEKLVEDLQGRTGLDFAGFADRVDFQTIQSALMEMIHPICSSNILTFCGHGFSHECFRVHAQSEMGYCAPATGQMILDFWRYYHALDDIANAMNTNPFFGTTWANEVSGLESLTCSHFDAEYDLSPTFGKVKTEIKANRPFDYSYFKHATACVGYREINIALLGNMPEESVYLYDPWPVGTGTIRWETYGTASTLWGPLSGFVYLRR